ncbi:hypothetical protein B0H63DRAFT_527371 [Podospora didyma]|uniref:Septation protein SUN4 n=1 Tax=Podospora didyma TaxID=330526 RepID=A0AAE0KA98_9PEZI|nr:hypothetical protein B0H63DRAFT_527371 [Podospora didyma]
MKGFMRTAVAAAVVVVAVAQPHNHQHGHRHRHVKNAASPIDKRAPAVVVTEVVEGPTEYKYVLDGQQVDPEEAEKGIEQGLYVVVGSTTPSFTSAAPIISTSTSIPQGGQFFEIKTQAAPTTSEAAPTTSSAAPPPPATSSAAPAPVSAPANIDEDFPSGKLKCDKVPTEYGAVEIPWAGTGGWTTIQQFGPWIKGQMVNNIVSPITGTCVKQSMCSYACPPGYQKTQWPEDSQGATGQSVGGLWCNDEGFLELTRPSHAKICEKGAGGVFIKNNLSGSSSAVCRTDYPGNEAMLIPLETTPGNTYPLTNPDSSTYYEWQGKHTTAQYYVNNKNVEVEQACTWVSSKHPDSAGNWAPLNIGVGKDVHGITYISLFPNLPTSHAQLDFKIEITGDISGTCSYENGQYSGGGNGCTVGLRDGTATIVFSD